MRYTRKEHQRPLAIEKWGWRYHHLGVPTSTPHPEERYLPEYKFYVRGFENSPFGVEWMRFEENCPVHELIQRVPHLAFEVDDLEKELRRHDFNVIAGISSPTHGIRVAMIELDGAPVELMEFKVQNTANGKQLKANSQ